MAGNNFKNSVSLRKKELAILGDLDTPELEEQYRLIAVDDIYSEKQLRSHFDLAKIEQLMNSMLVNGQIEPIIVCDIDGKGHRIQKGECRWRAAKMSDGRITHLKCLVRKDKGTVLSQFSENYVRADFTPFEVGEGFIQIKEEQNWSNKDVAKHFNVSESVVNAYIKCLDSPDFIKEAYSAGKVSDVDTINSLRIAAGINMDAVVDLIMNNEQLTRSQAQALTKSLKTQKKQSEAETKDSTEEESQASTSDEENQQNLDIDTDTENDITEPAPDKAPSKAPEKKTQNRIKVMVDGYEGVIDHTAKAEPGYIVVLMDDSPGQMTVPVSDVTLVGYAS
ncbi:TPA: ParB/RepB/Spo0J family partition protein [Vibrio cholerae]|nr:ParB/RepB/Spo0J family partition protein [Vibrio cholerae]HAS2771687.1 ParB/RepB/Spo0J family partition protein [Vibrio cholerae]HAS4509431.1 ParB/RepB/Spo0J family partition protein [Vibrio cholerae]